MIEFILQIKRLFLWLFLGFFICFVSPLPGLAEKNQHAEISSTIVSASEYDYPPFCLVTDKGEATGFSVELLQASLQAMGHTVSFNVGPWPEVKQSLIDRKVQVLPLVGRTPEREKYFDFTFPYLNMHGTIIVRSDERNIDNLEKLKGREVAVLEGDNAEEFLRRNSFGAKIITTESFETALRNLAKGQYDAVVIQKLLAMQLIKKAGLKNLRSIGPPLKEFKQSFCFAVPKGESELLGILNEGLSIVIADGTFKRLRAKWFSSAEVSGHSRIIVGGDNNYPPYEFLDKNGNPTGFNVELTRAIAKRLNLDVDIQLDVWKNIRQGIHDGRVDLVQGMFYSADRDKTVDFSPAHSIVGHTVVCRANDYMPQNMSELVGKSILVMAGDIMHDIAIQHGYKQQLVAVASQEEALRLLAAGEHDCALMARIPALYWIEKNSWDNLKVGDHSIISPEYCYATLHGNEFLLTSISDALATLKQSGEYRKIYSKWFSAYEPQTSNYPQILKYALFSLLPVLLVLIGVVVWNKLLQRQVAERTAELQKEMAGRKVLEEQLRQAEKMQAIGQLAGGIAHDFNNQLSGILGFANLLNNKLTDEKQQRHLRRLTQAAQRAAELTQQLLAFSRRGKYLATPTDIQKIVHDVASILQHSIDKNIQLHIHVKTTETVVLGDPSQLQNALLNVALNARDAVQGAGNITFYMDAVNLNQADCDRTLYDVSPGRFLKVCLSDDGSGMDEETQLRIFEPFFTTKETGKGTGMGLASVYGTITGHKGMIQVSSKLGKGTTFCIFLPISEDLPEDKKPSDSGVISGKANILVVDDEDDVRIVCSEMLEELGYNVKVYSNGQAAIEYYRRYWQQVDLIILDMMMPGLSGKETFLALQKINPQVRTILLSGFSLNEQVQELLDLGATAYQGKPFDQKALSKIVADVLSVKGFRNP